MIEDDRILSCSNIYNYCMDNFSLPLEYDQLEYIQTTGIEYIDTELIAPHGFHAIIDLEILDRPPGSDDHECIIGAHGNAPNYSRNYFSYYNDDVWFGAGDGSGYFDGGYRHQRHIYDFSNKYDDIYLRVDGVEKTYTIQGHVQPTDEYDTNSLYIFYGHSSEGTRYFSWLSAKLYSLELKAYFGEKRVFVPAKRNDGTVGLYDVVHRKFHTNIGSGSLIEGPVVNRLTNFGDRPASMEYAKLLINKTLLKYRSSLYSTDNTISGKRVLNALNFKQMLLKYINSYTELEYIVMDGYSYINVEYYPTNNTHIIIDIKNDSVQINPTHVIVGSRTTESIASTTIWVMSVNSLRFDYGTKNANVDFSNSGVRFTIELDKNVGKINSNTVATFDDTVPFVSKYPLTVGTVHSTKGDIDSNGYDNRRFKGNVYSLKIYDNDTLVRDCVPAQNVDGQVGLYDLVENKFYGNSGTGSITAGPEI